MPNMAYLCCARQPHTYPSFQEKAYDPAAQTVACCSSCVPLLWFALFRPEDIRVEELVADGVTYREPAPVASRDALKTRLNQSVPQIESALPRHGALGEHAELLLKTIDSVDPAYPYITIEMEEMAAIIGRDEFYESVPDVLAYFGGADDPDTVESIQEMFQGRKFRPPSSFVARKPTTKDWETLDLLLGEGLERDVLWEQ
jgi:hypothetical protein